MPFAGIFCRWESTTQTPAIAVLQVRSGEIWGRTPKDGFSPAVKAYPWRLDGRRGIEFTTPIQPHFMSAPHEARWYLRLTPGVELRQKAGEDYACIKAVIENHQL
jgi:hypothetical protein